MAFHLGRVQVGWATNPRTNCAGLPTEGNAARYSVVLVRGEATARQPLDAASKTAHPAAHAHAQPSSGHHRTLRVSGAAATMATPRAAAGHNVPIVDPMPSLAKEWRGGAELQVLLGGSVRAEVHRCVDEDASHKQRHRGHECAPKGQPQPGWARPMAAGADTVGAYGSLRGVTGCVRGFLKP